MTNSPYYEITLHQNWVEIFGCENNGVAAGNMDVFVEREVVSGESGATKSKKYVVDGIVWFEALKGWVEHGGCGEDEMGRGERRGLNGCKKGRKRK